MKLSNVVTSAGPSIAVWLYADTIISYDNSGRNRFVGELTSSESTDLPLFWLNDAKPDYYFSGAVEILNARLYFDSPRLPGCRTMANPIPTV